MMRQWPAFCTYCFLSDETVQNRTEDDNKNHTAQHDHHLLLKMDREGRKMHRTHMLLIPSGKFEINKWINTFNNKIGGKHPVGWKLKADRLKVPARTLRASAWNLAAFFVSATPRSTKPTDWSMLLSILSIMPPLASLGEKVAERIGDEENRCGDEEGELDR